MNRNRPLRRLIILLFWVAVWQIVSLCIDNAIIFVGPIDVVRSFIILTPQGEFWLAICSSFGKITLGFFTAFICGIALGSLAYRYSLVKECLEPLVHLMKSIPVASFVILALIWIGSGNLSTFISFTVVFPSIYVSTIAGLESTDTRLLEMARVFSLPLHKRIHFIYIPALLPHLTSSCRIALGMSWKSGIAAEVIGIPAHTIGEQLYLSKIYLNTADVFVWTIVIIIISALFEQLLLKLIHQIGNLL